MKDAAKEGDHIVAVDTHLVLGVPTPAPFDGILDAKLSPNVLAEHKYVALEGSTATNTPLHVAPTGSFDVPPHNKATVIVGKRSVLANHLPVARHDDAAETCNDPKDERVGKIVAKCTVKVGG